MGWVYCLLGGPVLLLLLLYRVRGLLSTREASMKTSLWVMVTLEFLLGIVNTIILVGKLEE